MQTIEVSEHTYAELQALARPFEDTPESVIVRLLRGERHGEATTTATSSAGSGRARPGSILPERDYWEPILRVLYELGGSAPAPEVIDRVGEMLRDRLTPRDREELQTGELRWRNRVQFARLRMKERGLLARDSRRGVWEITDEGRRYLEQMEGSA